VNDEFEPKKASARVRCLRKFTRDESRADLVKQSAFVLSNECSPVTPDAADTCSNRLDQ
jgi:hypothetical protein